ncbi:MAG TPA: PIN domain nuclease [Firmicutes bacterium]|nr:PIN domain nuclease [Bacillota bacterium]HHY99359.1 PIN domain nuclease [Bacillota bacterium]
MRHSERIAVDANIIISAIIGGKSGRIFLNETQLKFVTTPSVLSEVREYLPVLAKKKGLPCEVMRSILDLLPILIVREEEYLNHLDAAEAAIGNRDPDDIPLLALAMAFNCPIWTNDNDFSGISGVRVYTTAMLASFLENS